MKKLRKISTKFANFRQKKFFAKFLRTLASIVLLDYKIFNICW
jgi:hypothetical protein